MTKSPPVLLHRTLRSLFASVPGTRSRKHHTRGAPRATQPHHQPQYGDSEEPLAAGLGLGTEAAHGYQWPDGTGEMEDVHQPASLSKRHGEPLGAFCYSVGGVKR